ncbi:SDR family oxidoreductase [Saliterribacillus persicus]|uniref:NAD(P)-dependent dehydrogenase (Short-subunit alcohol dehydrogenase family) n=1 Tax=Saliterribacillus persicus TaxID=930114 RepID=A0A368YCP9_9BACI|nr:SDR family oxidoreductase [Saliterribacillus persicus]RCW77198.1 NAD(P)-dependent dehydrogenase (short-subunit alcohol dehydrogenase family) [Saliterribacillus persicus]
MKILITGANRGLGLSLAKEALEEGYHVIAGTRSLNEAATSNLTVLKENYNAKLDIFHMDVTEEASIEKAAQQTKHQYGSVDVLINNAAILNERDKSIEELDLAAIQKAFDVNTLGPVRVIKHFLPLLRESSSEKRAILNISSEAGSLTHTYSGDYPYGMSKVSLNMLTEKLRVYLKEDKVKVLSIHPGWMKTDMGGEKAPTNPDQAAKDIMKIINDKIKIEGRFAFINADGTEREI